MNIKIATLSILLCAGNAMASNHDNPWYAGARIGSTQYSDFTQNQFSDNNRDDSDTGLGIFLGHNFNEWFALEGAYTHLGSIEVDDNVVIKNNTLELVGKFTWQATESFDLFAKMGAYGYHTSGEDLLTGYSDKGINGTAGIGLEYHFTEALSVRAEYQYYNDSTLYNDDYDADWDTHFVALSLVYSWGKPKSAPVNDAPVIESKRAVETEPVVESTPVVEEKVAVAKTKSSIKVENETAEVYFDTNSYKLSEESISQLQPIIGHLKDHPSATIVAVGHTDYVGSEESNQILSENRAAAVKELLSVKYSIEPARITSEGKGETAPIADNDTAAGRAINRRVSVFSPSFFVTEE